MKNIVSIAMEALQEIKHKYWRESQPEGGLIKAAEIMDAKGNLKGRLS